MKITIEKLRQLDACPEAIDWMKSHKERDFDKLIKIAKNSDPEKLQWAVWLIVRLLPKKKRLEYAVYIARKVLPIFEKRYPKDKRPRKAIEAAEKYLQDGTPVDKKVRDDVCAAARAAWAADADAAAAAWVAVDAAADAWAVADAWAAVDAAWDVADAVEDSPELLEQMVDYGVEMLICSKSSGESLEKTADSGCRNVKGGK